MLERSRGCDATLEIFGARGELSELGDYLDQPNDVRVELVQNFGGDLGLRDRLSACPLLHGVSSRDIEVLRTRIRVMPRERLKEIFWWGLGAVLFVSLVQACRLFGWPDQESVQLVAQWVGGAWGGFAGLLWGSWTAMRMQDAVLYGGPCLATGLLFGYVFAGAHGEGVPALTATAVGAIGTWSAAFWVGHLRAWGVAGASFVRATEAIRPISLVWLCLIFVQFALSGRFDVSPTFAADLTSGVLGLASLYLYAGPGLSQYRSALETARGEQIPSWFEEEYWDDPNDPQNALPFLRSDPFPVIQDVIRFNERFV